MEITRLIYFLGCLIIAAKVLNDKFPMNKHWSKHSNYLLSNKEINTAERELLSYLKWDVILLCKRIDPLLKGKIFSTN